MYIIKKVIGAMANPLTIALLFVGIAALLRFRGHMRAASRLLIVAALIAYLGSIRPVADLLLAPLENRYPPLQDEEIPEDVRNVVVLGSGYYPREGLPVTAALDAAGLARIVEGVRLIRRLDSARLIVFGGAPQGRPPTAEGYARMARELGVSEATLMVLDEPLDTGEEAQAVFDVIGDEALILVTSASHMPRAMQLMHRAGALPIPAPTGHRVLGSGYHSYRFFIPGSYNLRKTERAMHEYLGLLALSVGID
jgi:uncharacterized SAM-binding protein YcdF (DUF218 family)